MKSFVFYLIWIALLLAGTRLVCRLQQHTRWTQALDQAEPTTFTGRPAANEAITNSSSTGLQQPLTDSSVSSMYLRSHLRRN